VLVLGGVVALAGVLVVGRVVAAGAVVVLAAVRVVVETGRTLCLGAWARALEWLEPPPLRTSALATANAATPASTQAS
jgi:hypothetical protein